MKKFLALLLAVVLLFGGFVTYKNYVSGNSAASLVPQASAEEAVVGEEADAEAQAEEAEVELPSVELDFDRLYALHDLDEVVMKVNGEDVTWGEYFYCVYAQAGKIMNSLEQMALYYGMSAAWDDPIDEETGETIEELAMSNSVEMFKQMKAIRSYIAENNIELTDEDEAQVKSDSDAYLIQLAGEDASDEEIEAALAKLYVTPEMFDIINRMSAYYDRGFTEKYGENCENVSDEDALKYLEDNRYMNANHILFMTVDPSTGEALSDEVKAEKKAQAEEVLAQLKAIEDKDELVSTFLTLKEQYCEDSGKVAYPNGYIFTPGTMVEPFENAVLSMGDYELSDIVETTYGYHIIMRLPLEPDAEIDTDSYGNPVTGRSLFAESDYAKSIQARMDESTVEYAEGYTTPKLSEFVK